MRRLFTVSVILLAGVFIALAALPWWLAPVLRLAGGSRGLEFSGYERLGYARFALTGVEFEHPGVRVTAERLEADSPVVFLVRHWSGNPQPVTVTTWRVAVKPEATASPVVAKEEASVGALILRDRLLVLATQLDRWLPVAEVGAGTVDWGDGDLEIGGAVWKQRSLDVVGLRFGSLAADAKATFSKSGVIEIDFSMPDGPWRFKAASNDAGLDGEFQMWEQTAVLSAQFAQQGWLPESASLVAAGWNVPGERVGLGGKYSTVRGDVRIDWRDGRFDTAIELVGEAGPESTAPPLSAKLRGHGDTETAVVESLLIDIPGVSARLGAPVEIDRQGRIKSGTSDFTFAVDLEKQPWIAARGRTSVSARLTPRDDGFPLIEARFEGTEMEWRDWHASAVNATGRFDWPELEITAAVKDESVGTELVAEGTWNFETGELLKGHASGTTSGESAAHLSSGMPAFGLATFSVDAHGSIRQLEHSGTVRVDDLAVPGLNPLGLEAAWIGNGATAQIRDGIVRAGNSEIFVSAQIAREGAELEALRLVQDGVERLALRAPASVQWSPALEVDSVQLEGDGCSLEFSAVWGESGQVHVAARNIPSTWLADFAPLHDLQWEIASLDFDGTWSDGPLSFETTGAIALNIGEDLLADVDLSARGDGNGIVLESLRVVKEESPIFTSHGKLPISFHPGEPRLLEVRTEGPLEVSTTSASSPLFWEKLRELTGVELIEPDLKLELTGTWSEPRGTLRATASRVSVDNERIDFDLPEIEALEIDAKADQAGLSLDRLSMLVGGQTVRATGRLPIGREGWEKLRSDPLTFIRSSADLHVEIPSAEIAALSVYAPAFLSPEGQLQMDVKLKSGGEIEGFLRLQGAASRPLGPLGVLQDISADLQFSGRAVELRQLVATSGGQPVTLSGRIELPADAPPKYDVVLKGSNLLIVRRTGLLLRGDIDLRLTTQEGGVPLISGEARLRDGLYLSDIRDLIPRGGGGVSARPPYFAVQTPPFNEWKLAVNVQGDKFLRLRTTLFNGNLSTRFRISGTLGDPRAIGEATVSEGRLLLPFATFAVQHGSARLTEDDPFEPRLELAGVSRLQGFDVRLELKGTASEPELTFTSSPPLGSDVLLGMVMAGEPAESDGTTSGTRRYARLGTYVGQGILRNLSSDGSDSERFSVTSGANVSRLGRETLDFEYRMHERFSLVGEYDEFDEFNSGVKWRLLRDRREPVKDSEAKAPDSELARIRVTGLGWLANWEQRRSLKQLLRDQMGESLDANAIEDAAILLLSGLADDGFKDASIELELTTKDGTMQRLTVDSTFSTALARPLEATSVVFRVTKGERQYVDDVSISGLTAIPVAKARRYFRPVAFLLATEASRPHTQSRLTRAVERLRDELNQLGFAEAEVRVENVDVDTDSGKVTIAIAVEEGPRWQVRSVRVSGADEFAEELAALQKFASRPWSRRWQQDVREASRRVLYAGGFPDAEVGITHEAGAVESGMKPVDVTITITRGGQVMLGEVRIEGGERTRESVIRRRIAANAGDPFDPIKLERSRYRLTRLGIFDSVEMRIEPEDGPRRDAIFVLEEGRSWGASVQLGYGTYERFRAGLEVSKRNLFGLAHQGRLQLVQSMKSSRGELSYTVPELFGESIDGTARFFGLEREETSFVRTEVGVNVALRRPIRQISGEASIGYTFQSLRNRDNELSTAPEDNKDVTVGSFDFGISSDWRDSPLRPRRGARLYGRLELASQAFGGESDFQHLVIGGSIHTALGTGRWLHFAMSHGVVTTMGSEDDALLPVNKRFYPGGDGSIRGYKLGEAAPRGEDGKFIGAKSYLRAGLDLEQALTESLSVVVFFDAIGVAARLADYPFEERLYSVGLGLRYHTIVGPIRLGYGHNLNPRVDDPSGTLYFSVGLPF